MAREEFSLTIKSTKFQFKLSPGSATEQLCWLKTIHLTNRCLSLSTSSLPNLPNAFLSILSMDSTLPGSFCLLPHSTIKWPSVCFHDTSCQTPLQGTCLLPVLSPLNFKSLKRRDCRWFTIASPAPSVVTGRKWSLNKYLKKEWKKSLTRWGVK